jgi:GTP1/Obg family GTP-binding protein
MGNNKIDNAEANKTLDKAMEVTKDVQTVIDKKEVIDKLVGTTKKFEESSLLVRNADTLKMRELAYARLKDARTSLIQIIKDITASQYKKIYSLPAFGTLLFLIDREMAILAPAYT